MDVTVCRRVTVAPWWAPVSRWAEALVAAVPQHRDTRSGRRNAQQLRVVLLATGIAVTVLWDSPVAPLALLLCFAALVVPLSESRKRQLLASLRAGRRRETVRREPGRLVLGEAHVELWSGEEQLRRLRRKGLQRIDHDGATELRAGGKLSERLTFVDAGDCTEALWVEGGRAALPAG